MREPRSISTPPHVLLLGLLATAGCTPTVQVVAPKEPIVINMNVKIEHEVRVKVDKELDELHEQRDDIF